MAINGVDKPEFPRLLVCEGPEDRYFFEELISARGIPRFHIWPAKGRSKFDAALRAFQLQRPKTFRQIGRIVIAADNNDAPVERFESVRGQIESVLAGC